ncbi:hypothetical protein PCANC_14691 [Puccinia coronata f. sp. avenae]|uniref:Uncharacterized protein n=1 Tax=Puccinia coronata f. sp. avenae TaxID=200324 RepID=A0A2N5US80_9BASI|nr:hypothetical protein PCANC_14691 [Puccinia coronata f. sp. avenae]PLW40487.1 hypothetical protein PCASD_08845 [Puccinia coronata f. sp. avenae]
MGYNIDHAPAQFDSHEMICVVGASIARVGNGRKEFPGDPAGDQADSNHATDHHSRIVSPYERRADGRREGRRPWPRPVGID